MRRIVVIFVVGMLAVVVGADALWAEGAQAAPTDANIARWIQELDSDDYFTRERAGRKLAESGSAAIGPLAEAIDGKNLEVTAWAISLVAEIGRTANDETAEAVESLLERLAVSEDRSLSARAKIALRPWRAAKREKAIRVIQQLGGDVSFHNGMVYHVHIGDQWQGGPEAFENLRWLPEVSYLTIHDTPATDAAMTHIEPLTNLVGLEINRTRITDAGLVHLAPLDNLVQLQLKNSPVADAGLGVLGDLPALEVLLLIGTEVTDDGETALAAARPNLRIDRRAGALLGVYGQAAVAGCEIVVVQPDSSAQRAGLQPGDVITHFNDQPLKDFDSLKDLIALKKAGDKAMIKFLRGGKEEQTREVTFGEW